MASVLVGIPIIKETRKVFIEKGRRWSVFEHAILEALARDDYDLASLENLSSLPGRVVIEIVIRLMRAGWIELVHSGQKTLFRSTALGRLSATLTELPPVTKIVPRHLSYAVDLVTGNVFRRSDLTLLNEDQWQARISNRKAVKLQEPSDGKYNVVPLGQIAHELLEDDEELVRVEPNDKRASRLIAIASVSDATIEGIGSDIPQQLEAVIRSATQSLVPSNKGKAISTANVAGASTKSSLVDRAISFRADDMILGGNAHKMALEQAIRRARYRIAIHSTFLSDSALDYWWAELQTAARKNVLIDILWGQSSDTKSLLAANRFRAKVAQHDLQGRIRVAGFSSGSHSKIVLADQGHPDQFQALIGSCNWLGTNFSMLEASIRLRDPHIISDLAFQLAELGRPRDGAITTFSTNMLGIARHLERLPARERGTAVARVVLGSEHGALVLRARDRASREIFLASHQLGAAAGPNLLPLQAAASSHLVKCSVLYGQFTDRTDAQKAGAQLLEMSNANMVITPIQKPELHAKVLTWDDSDIVITSQNWLSSDPSNSTPRSEIGIYLSAPRAAEIFMERFRACKDYSA